MVVASSVLGRGGEGGVSFLFSIGCAPMPGSSTLHVGDLPVDWWLFPAGQQGDPQPAVKVRQQTASGHWSMADKKGKEGGALLTLFLALKDHMATSTS